jgi:carbamoyl-phosphate synthase large subunit
MPRWTFEKFPESDETLTTQMKSIGEAMAIGRTFKEAFQKCVRSMEIKRNGLGLDTQDAWLDFKRAERAVSLQIRNGGVKGWRSGEAVHDWLERAAKHWPIPDGVVREKLIEPCQGRPYYIRYAFKLGYTIDAIYELTKIDPWFLSQIKDLCDLEAELLTVDPNGPDAESLYCRALQAGYSYAQLKRAWNIDADRLRQFAEKHPGHCYKAVDTCAAEFEAYTPYYYSTHETPYRRNGSLTVDNELTLPDKECVMILGGGPNRIGQGIEFDYCCVHATQAARSAGFAAVMVNSNPETVSTDYDTSDVLFFEPLTIEDVLNICDAVRDKLKGVIVQFGGQTPLNLSKGLADAGVPILGTSVDAIHIAEDRSRFQKIMNELGFVQPPSDIAYSVDEAVKIANTIGYPVMVRPSFVLGGRAMEVCNDESDLRKYMETALTASDAENTEPAILIDRFLQDAIEVDVDAVADFGLRGDAGSCVICGVMEHIEEAGIHSGDSSCAIPPYSISRMIVDDIERQTKAIARRLGVTGLMNIQFAVKSRRVYVLEVNPRASRTVPFVSKATGVPWARIATEVMLGRPLNELLDERGYDPDKTLDHVSVKGVVFPFNKFPGVDVVLGPEMRSTGEVMGVDRKFGMAFAKARIAAGQSLPTEGRVYISVNDEDKPFILPIARQLGELGFTYVATAGTADRLRAAGIDCAVVKRISQSPDDNMLHWIEQDRVQLLINTATVTGRFTDEGKIRAASVRYGIPLITTLTEAHAAVEAIQALRAGAMTVKALQDYDTMCLSREPATTI